MKTTHPQRSVAVKLTVLCAALAASATGVLAQVTFQEVTNGLVDFYPLDYLNEDGVTTPDVINRRDMILYGMGTSNIVASTHPGGAVTNCFDFTQTGSGTVIYYNSTGQDPLTGGGDFLPFINQRNATMNFWVKSSTTSGDKRFFGECDTTGASANPIFLIGSSSGAADNGAHFLFRQQENTGPGGSITMVDGTYEFPAPGYYWTQGASYTSNSVLDGNWHMFTMTIDSNASVNVYVDGVLDIGAGTQLDFYGNPACLNPLFVTNTYYTTNIYPSAGVSNPPPDGYVHWMMNAVFKTGDTAFGGFKRGGVSGGVVGQIDDIGFWDRVLSSDEVAFVMTNGLPGLVLNTNKISINSFAADLGEVGVGDTVGLSWKVSGASAGPGGITISGVGDVSDIGPVGSTNVTLAVNQTYTFTLTAHNGIVPDQTASVTVKTFPGVASDWHLVQRFDGLFSDTTTGIEGHGWVSTKSDYTGVPRDRWNVITTNNNEVLTPRTGYAPDVNSTTGYESRGSLAYGLLNGLTIPPGQNNTLFFRFSIKEPAPYDLGGLFLLSDMDCGIGMSDFNFVGPLSGAAGPGNAGNVGPYFSIIRNSQLAYNGGPFDLFAQDYGGTGVTNSYSYIASVDPNGLDTNVVYYVWMDIQNRDTHAEVIAGVTNTVDEPLYSVWLQKQGDPTRTLLFSGFHGNRDYVGYNPAIDSPTPYLNKVFVSIGDESIANGEAGAYITTNMIAVDDFYLSKSGVDSTIPKLFDIRAISRSGNNVTIVWDSLGSMYGINTYTIQRSPSLVNPTWTTLEQGYPSGGDSTSYTDTTATDDIAYYRIVWP